ncbi:MAG TPA: hypothetical protein VMD74_01560 [Candidatus Methylomirabilis sp.]|nr:hypothetical protein [Candidatus Methylomirabilis sp.]
MYYKIASISLANEQKSDVAGEIFIAQPDSEKEALVGKLIILAEIQAPRNDAAKVLSFLTGNLNYNYYQNEKVILKERIETISLENIFESALTKTNKDLADFLTEEKIRISPYAFNVTIGVLYKNELYFSGIGKNKCLLIYKEKVVPKAKGHHEPEAEQIEYKITDVGEQTESEALNINKLFSTVTKGKIPLGGYFLVVNEALSEYLSHKQLIRIVTKLSPSGAAEQIRNLLEQINSYVSFLGIIIKNTFSLPLSGEELKNKLAEEESDDDYTPEITATEEKTESIMKPAGIINLKKWTHSLEKKISPATITAPAEKISGKKTFLFKEKIFFKKRSGLISWLKIKNFLLKCGRLAKSFLSFLWRLIARRSATETKADLTIDVNIKDGVTPFWSRRKITIILVLVVLLLGIFAINIYITDRRNKAAEQQKQFNSLIASIEKNQNKIEADFLYGNRLEITDLFNQDKDLLAKIPQADIAKRQDVKALFDRQQQQAEKIQNINKISGLPKIADFSNLTAAADPQNLLQANGVVYAGDAKNHAVFKIDLKENIVTAVYNFGSATSSALSFPSAGQNNNVYYLSDNSILQLDQAGNAAPLALSFPSARENIVGVVAYSDKLYLLDKSLGQIFRYTKSDTGFVNQTKWLNQSADFSGASDMFIDGNVYVLYKDGRVEQYLKGKKQDFSLAAVTPAITDARRLIVTPDRFYVLEPGAKRLTIWDNKGAYLAQYIFTDLNNLKDFAVNDQAKQIYLLDGHAIYQLAIPTIK